MGRMAFIFVFILTFYIGTNIYTGRRVFVFAQSLLPHINSRVYMAIYILLALSLILGFFPLPFGLKGVMRSVGSYWMGIYVYLLIFFIVADLILLFLPQGARFYAGLTVILLTAGVLCHGIYNAHQIKIVSYDVQLQKAALSEELIIVLISDLHLGETHNDQNLDKIVQGVNSLNPDIVCIAGDIFTDDVYAIRDPDKAIDSLRSIQATYGVYACLGNHDAGSTFDGMLAFLEQSNVTLLNDEYVIIDGRLILLGRLDPSPIGGSGELRRKDFSELVLDANLPVIVMDHNPGNIDEYGTEVDLILSGHTHKGQIFPGSLFTKVLYTVDYGYYRKDGNSPHVIVSQGAGTWMMPVRVGTSNEIVSISLR